MMAPFSFRTGVCTNSTAPSVSSINRILRNRAAERAAAEFARVGGYAGLYYGSSVAPPGSHPGASANASAAMSALQSWPSASGYPPSLLSQLAAGSGLFLPNGIHGSLSGLHSGLAGLSAGMNGSLARSPRSREDTPHSISPKPSPEMVNLSKEIITHPFTL